MATIIASILDNDLYKFSMGYGYMKLYPDAEGTFQFKDRENRQYNPYTVGKIKEAIEDLSNLRLTDEEFKWAVAHIPYIPQVYWEWLKGFRYDPSKVTVSTDEEGHLHIEVTDKLYKSTLYEVPILAIVSHMSNMAYSVYMPEVVSKLNKKIELSNENALIFSDFGTRRRFNYDVHDTVVRTLKNNALYCTGTSNVHFAMKYDMKPIGTVAHEWVMFHGANNGFRNANYEAYEAWVKVYDGALGIALTDTYKTDAFLNNFSKKLAKLFDGVRHDSGDEFVFVDKVIARYKELGINPMLKTIVFSNALTFQKFKTIADYCKDRIGTCCAGIGTNLTNDTGFKPSNIVMKLSSCRMNANQRFVPCIKISDDEGKVMGDENELRAANIELNLNIEGI